MLMAAFCAALIRARAGSGAELHAALSDVFAGAYLVLVGCLCAADEQVLVTLSGHHDGPVGLEVKVLLPAELDGALHHMVGSCMQARNAKTSTIFV